MKFIAFLLTTAFLISAQGPDFEPVGPLLLSNGDTIRVEYGSSPLMSDWDGDELNDLITGEIVVTPTSTRGMVRLYLNKGTSDAPVFDEFSYLQADDTVLTVPACGY